MSVGMWVLTPALWEELLTQYGLITDHVDVLTAPDDDTPPACTVVQARRPSTPADG